MIDRNSPAWIEKQRLKENNRARNEKHRRLHLKLPAKTEQLYLSQQLNPRKEQYSPFKPKLEEYAELSPKAQRIINLTGCKYLIGEAFCNLPRLKGKAYCQEHYDLCYYTINNPLVEKHHD